MRRAQQRLDAALAVLLDARCDPEDARQLLTEGWRLAAGVALGLITPGLGEADGELAALLPPLVERGARGLPRREVLEARLAPLLGSGTAVPATAAGQRRMLLGQAHLLQRLVDGQRAELRRQHGRWAGYFPWRRVAVSLVALCLAGAGAAAVYLVPRAYETGWRAEYFPTPDLTGTSEVRREHTLAFFWSEGPPIPGFPADRFSARFDTCLDVQQAGKVVFSLGSDDGGRLFVDGEKVAEDWGGHAMRFVPATRELRAGFHHLRVEYQELILGAALQLKIGLGDAPPETPQAWQVVMPDPDAPADAPCAGLE
ncbi:MAG: hypothetical protein HY904_19035 [Deltaproteobacteria bacterium]|nr:hypothetical protein [Deltaproteobacteria bacterium]